jgi:hypothetical protein
MPFIESKELQMELKTKHRRRRLPLGRPPGISQPKGPERIRRKVAVIYDSVLKRALAGEADQARLALEIVGELPLKKRSAQEIVQQLVKVTEEAV